MYIHKPADCNFRLVKQGLFTLFSLFELRDLLFLNHLLNYCGFCFQEEKENFIKTRKNENSLKKCSHFSEFGNEFCKFKKVTLKVPKEEDHE